MKKYIIVAILGILLGSYLFFYLPQRNAFSISSIFWIADSIDPRYRLDGPSPATAAISFHITLDVQSGEKQIKHADIREVSLEAAGHRWAYKGKEFFYQEESQTIIIENLCIQNANAIPLADWKIVVSRKGNAKAGVTLHCTGPNGDALGNRKIGVSQDYWGDAENPVLLLDRGIITYASKKARSADGVMGIKVSFTLNEPRAERILFHLFDSQNRFVAKTGFFPVQEMANGMEQSILMEPKDLILFHPDGGIDDLQQIALVAVDGRQYPEQIAYNYRSFSETVKITNLTNMHN